MLVDPLCDDPLIITGSANFSDASTTKNDENMLVIRGDTRVADIYLRVHATLYAFLLSNYR
jgi:phosphatidylserine/phosphatidylglycerophosphate/cardiolipin synthase-like enzyme